MLETRNLKKIYKTKKGVSVEALKGVSLKFPEKGMVFLLGKSGSGKSTLLNLLGGLDKYDDGEIIINGKSSKDFKQSHFDSYRNTYVGFIFQEYNVLEEFSVGANIALALELQGRKATDEEINEILKQVDLDGFGDRKPNELSGGQKQRVAIARALVKNPQIIMADEPTGALDSATGRQVLETLKKLSENKLVVVVSHDREFADNYADRIIELADGNVINDIERVIEYKDAEDGSNNKNVTFQYEAGDEGIEFSGNTMVISKGYHLTEEDRMKINEYISALEDNLNVKVGKQKRGKFRETNQEDIREGKSEFQLIKSKLRLKNSFKIGAGALKHKKIRLVITILLSFAAFSMFALADTFGNYNHVDTCANSIVDTNITYASVAKSVKVEFDNNDYYWDEWNHKLVQEDIDLLIQDTGLDFKGVYTPNDNYIEMTNYDTDIELSKNDETTMYATYFSGFAEVTKEDLDQMGYQLLAGEMPDGSKDEMAVSKYVYETYAKAGYVENGDNTKKININNYKDLIGKTLNINGKKMTITGIVDTDVDMERYKSASESTATKSSAERLSYYALNQELENIKDYSLACVIMTGKGYVEKMMENKIDYISLNNTYFQVYNNKYSSYCWAITKLSNIDSSKITWLDGEKKQLNEKEVIVSISDFVDEQGNGMGEKAVLEAIKSNNAFTADYCLETDFEGTTETGWKIVGVIDSGDDEELSGITVVPDEFYEKGWGEEQGDFSFAVASMPDNTADIKNLVRKCYKERDNVRYKMKNSVTYELDSVNEILQVLSKVFLYVGIGFAIFAAIMLSNFIATSIAYKKQEIGILRAIGARSNDVFRIFFSESFIIAMINFVLSCIGSGIVTSIINGAIRKEAGILITVLNFEIRQIVLLFVISIVVAAVASFIPVYKIASKKPIEAIRNR